MASSFPSFFLVAVLFYCLAAVCLPCTFADENPIRLASDGLHDDIPEDSDPSFSSIPIEAIYQFGDSISDTGNLIRDNPSATRCGKWPYGETFFKKPTGRCSDGLLMVDYIAKFLNLPFTEVYLNKDGNFTHGVNFAVAGATALTTSTLKQIYNISTITNLSLSVQLGWFNSHIQSFYTDVSERRKKLSKGLFLVGEVGGNDYNFAFFHGKSLSDVYKMVPEVVQAIKNATKEIIELGATHIVVPGNFPLGCLPDYLSLFKTNDSSMYDELKCLKQYNDHAKFHNDLLQQSILELQMDHPNVAIVYVDYFGGLMEILRDAALLGFDENAIYERCCGSPEEKCGIGRIDVCKNPQKYISWDGIHLTQHAYHVLAKHLISSILLAFQNDTKNLYMRL